jgi:hypothetical protein
VAIVATVLANIPLETLGLKLCVASLLFFLLVQSRLEIAELGVHIAAKVRHLVPFTQVSPLWID